MKRRLLILAALAALALGVLIPAGSAYQGSPVGVWTWPGAQLLTVNTSPEPTPGYVVSDAAYIACPIACVRPYDRGAVVRLTAWPSRGLSFSHWTGAACAGQGATCTLTMTQATEVTAVFAGTLVPEPPPPAPAAQTFTLALTLKGGAKTVSVTGSANCVHPGGADTVCNYAFALGTNVTLTQIAGGAGVWSGACGGGGACVLLMEANRAVARSDLG